MVDRLHMRIYPNPRAYANVDGIADNAASATHSEKATIVIVHLTQASRITQHQTAFADIARNLCPCANGGPITHSDSPLYFRVRPDPNSVADSWSLIAFRRWSDTDLLLDRAICSNPTISNANTAKMTNKESRADFR